MVRREATRLIIGYAFDLRKNTLKPRTIPNPSAGKDHVFLAWRLPGGSDQPVIMRELVAEPGEGDEDAEE